MACNCLNSQTLAGLTMDCQGNLGGIKTVYLTNYTPDFFKISGGTVTGFTTASGTVVYEYCLRKNLSSFSQQLTVNDNSSRYLTSTLTMVFPRMDATKRLEAQALAYADVSAVILDCNGQYWAVGVSEPLSSSDGTGETGTQKTDTNAYTIILSNEEPEYAYPLTESAVTALLALLPGSGN